MADRESTILEFAKSHDVCVISTGHNNQPESAVVDFVMTNNLKIIFNTYTTSRKWKIMYMKYFKVEPSWIRLSDFNEYPPKKIELKF